MVAVWKLKRTDNLFCTLYRGWLCRKNCAEHPKIAVHAPDRRSEGHARYMYEFLELLRIERSRVIFVHQEVSEITLAVSCASSQRHGTTRWSES